MVGVLNCGYGPGEECDLVLAKPFEVARLRFVTDDGRIETVPDSARHDAGEVIRVRLSGEMTVHPFDVRFFFLDPAATD